jgi:regulator of protease activity HflC (stomatin/prohibitin superfamily)
MSSRISQLLTAAGVGLVALSNCIFLVDPGEKALIMNNFTGLKQKVFNQGINMKIPFIEVYYQIFSLRSSMMQGLSLLIFMLQREQKICKL